jgi:hypothetical protein
MTLNGSRRSISKCIVILFLTGCAAPKVKDDKFYCNVLLVKEVYTSEGHFWKAYCDPGHRVIKFNEKVEQGENIEYSPYISDSDPKGLYGYVKRRKQ